MVPWKGVVVKLTAPSAEGKPPTVESAVDNCFSSHNGDGGPMLSMSFTQKSIDVPSRTFPDTGVSVRQPGQCGSAHGIRSEQGDFMPQTSSVMTSHNDGEANPLARGAISTKDRSNNVEAVGEGEITAAPDIKLVEEKKSVIAGCLVDAEFKVEELAGESTQVLPVCPGEKQRQTDVETEEINAEVGQDYIAEYMGRKVLKRFGRKDFIGDVVNYEPEYSWYKVVYEDGDEEDLERAEVEAILLPLGSFTARASRKRPPSENTVEDGYERDLKKTKVDTRKHYREGKKARMLRSKKTRKNVEAVADLQGYKGKVLSKKASLAEKLRGIGRDSDSDPPRSWKSGKPCGRILQKNPSGVTGYKTVSTVIKNKESKAGKGSWESSRKGLPVNTSSPCKLKISKQPTSGVEKPLQEREDMENSCSPFKNDSKERRRSATGITLQEGIKRYLQKLKDAQQGSMPRANRQTDGDSTARPGHKHSEKGTAQNCRAAVNPFSEGLEDSDQGNRESKDSIVEGHYSDDVEVGATLVGRSTRKKFSGKLYRGNVVSYDKKTKFYKVRYEDGDEEDLEWSELEPTLVVNRKQNSPVKFIEATRNFWSSVASVSERHKDCNQGNRAGKHLKVKDHDSGVELGATLVGRSTRKKFGGKFYIGNVVSYDKKTKFYKVRYEDGDQEDLEWTELEPTLVAKRKQSAAAKSTSMKGFTSKSISDGRDVQRRKTRSIPY